MAIGDAVGQPLQVVDHPDQRAATRGQPDRPEVGAEEVGPQRAHRRRDVVGGRRHRRGGRPGSGTPARRAAEFVVMARRQQEQRGGNGERERDEPAEEAFGNGTGGRAGGQHEVISVERWPAATISLSTPENVTATARTNIVSTRQPGDRRHQRAKGDEDDAVDAEPAVRQRPAGRLPGKSTVISRATEPKIANSGVCEPLPTAKPTAAASGSTIAARAARRARRARGSRSLMPVDRPAPEASRGQHAPDRSPAASARVRHRARTGRSPARRAAGRRSIADRGVAGRSCDCS